MGNERSFALAAGLAILFWLLSGQRGIDPRLRRWMLLCAYGVLAVAILYALLRSLAWFLG